MEYYTAATVNEALTRLKQPRAKIIAGGTDLCVQMEEHIIRPDVLVDISSVQELNIMEVRSGSLHIGAGVTISELAESDLPPLCLQQGARAIGSPQIRNVATIGGNICNASPCGDTLSPLVALDAEFILVSAGKERSVKAVDFFTGPKATVMKGDEILREIIIPEASCKGASAFRMIGKRKGQVISQVNTVVWLSGSADLTGGKLTAVRPEDARIAVGSVAPVPFRLEATEKFVKEKCAEFVSDLDSLKEKITNTAAAEIAPIDDVRASKEYRYTVTGALLFDTLLEALRGLSEMEP